MPKKAIDYSKCMFYRLVCRDITVIECYVGHTTNEVDRRYKHKSDCHNEKAKGFNQFVYRFIRDHGGFENWQLLVHEHLAVKDDVAARLRERFWCEHYKSTLNTQVPGRTGAEWYINHREEKAEYRAEYRAEHREERNQQIAAWTASHEAHLKEKHECECGGCYTTNGKSHHFKTARHCAYIATLPAI
jgi:hypothetical protein